MILSFTVENWMSFREPTTLSMVATRERQHGKSGTEDREIPRENIADCSNLRWQRIWKNQFL